MELLRNDFDADGDSKLIQSNPNAFQSNPNSIQSIPNDIQSIPNDIQSHLVLDADFVASHYLATDYTDFTDSNTTNHARGGQVNTNFFTPVKMGKKPYAAVHSCMQMNSHERSWTQKTRRCTASEHGKHSDELKNCLCELKTHFI